MAQDSIVGGLFGITPESLDLAQRQREQAMAIQYAGLDPMQRAAYGTFMAGQQLGRGIGSLLGIEDPQLKMVTQRQQIMRGIDPNDPEALSRASMLASEMGDPRLAAVLAEQRRKALESASLVAQRLRERADPFNKLVESGKYTPESLAAYQKSGNTADLVLVEKPQPDIAEQLILKADFTPESIAKFSQTRDYKDLVPIQKKGIGQSISEGLTQGLGTLAIALAPALKKEGEVTGKFTAENYDKLARSVSAGVSSRRDLNSLNDALKNSFTGAFADSKKSIVSSLSSLGLPVDKDLLEAASNTELVDAMATKYIFPLVKNFPGALAVKELETLKKAAPGSQQQLRTIVKLIDVLNTSLIENEYTYNNAKNYKAQKGTLIGFSESDARVDFQRKYDRIKEIYNTAQARGNKWSREESAEFNSLKAELGVK